MADKPIIFSAAMVNALLAGRKTQTRRVLKVQPPEPCEFAGFYSVPLSGAFQCRFQGDTTIYTQRLPYAPGDRLWVREHWRTADAYDDLSPSQMGGEEPVIYLADDTLETWGWRNDFVPGRFRQAMHMPRWASRLTLTVTDVRVQRLTEISAADSIAEGVQCGTCEFMNASACNGRGCFASIAAFQSLWNSLHGPDAWDANPWVAAYSFTVQHGNIDTQGDPQ
jgi:hypothetical protein